MLVKLARCLPGAILFHHFVAVAVVRKRNRQFIVDGTPRSCFPSEAGPDADAARMELVHYMEDTVLVLDAMGVIYAAADDVEELSVTFVFENGELADGTTVARHYTRASLGEIDAATFWRAVGLSPRVEDEYLILQFRRSIPIACRWVL